MRLALATQRDLPEWEHDDEPFHAALRQRGVDVCLPAWDDADVDWASFDACLIRTTWDYMHKADAYLAWADRVGAQIPLFNPASVVRWSLDKRYLAQLDADGIPHAPTVWIDAHESIDVAATMRTRGWDRGFLKPVVGCSAQGTLRFDTSAPSLEGAQQHLDASTAGGAGMMLQPYLETVETQGEVSALFFDGQFSHGVRKVPVAGDYRVQDDYGASDEPYRFTDRELELAKRTREAAERRLGLHQPLLYARADFLRNNDGSLSVTELELVEPSLFFRHDDGAADRLAEALLRRVGA